MFSPNSLELRVRAECNPNWFGPECQVFCEPRDDVMGHYTCDGNTGAFVCLAGIRLAEMGTNWTDN